MLSTFSSIILILCSFDTFSVCFFHDWHKAVYQFCKMSKEERESIRNAQYIYGLEEKKEKKRVYTDAEKQKIDEVDALREKMKRKKEETDEALDFFREG